MFCRHTVGAAAPPTGRRMKPQGKRFSKSTKDIDYRGQMVKNMGIHACSKTGGTFRPLE